MMIEKMEKKYGITIRDDSFVHPLTGKFYKRYKIYTADGCLWENGLSFRGLQAECRRYGEKFHGILRAATDWLSMTGKGGYTHHGG